MILRVTTSAMETRSDTTLTNHSCRMNTKMDGKSSTEIVATTTCAGSRMAIALSITETAFAPICPIDANGVACTGPLPNTITSISSRPTMISRFMRCSFDKGGALRQHETGVYRHMSQTRWHILSQSFIKMIHPEAVIERRNERG